MSTTITAKSKRVDSFDIARGIGIILMVIAHEGFGPEVDKMIQTFHMPLFFFVSGFFYRPNKITNMRSYVLHLSKSLLVPYVCFAVFYEFLHYIFVGEVSIKYFFLSLVTSNHNRIDVAGALWFLLCLFSAKVLYHALCSMIKNEKTLTIVVISLGIIANYYRRYDIYLPFGLDSAQSCLPLIHAGYYLYKYKETKYGKLILNYSTWFFIACVVVWFTVGVLNDNVIVRRNKYGIVPLYWICCFAGMFMTLNISAQIDIAKSGVIKKVKYVLVFLGKESLTFLVLNELMIYVSCSLLNNFGISQDLIDGNYFVRGLILVITLAALFVCALIAKKKPVSYLFGKW